MLPQGLGGERAFSRVKSPRLRRATTFQARVGSQRRVRRPPALRVVQGRGGRGRASESRARGLRSSRCSVVTRAQQQPRDIRLAAWTPTRHVAKVNQPCAARCSDIGHFPSRVSPWSRVPSAVLVLPPTHHWELRCCYLTGFPMTGSPNPCLSKKHMPSPGGGSPLSGWPGPPGHSRLDILSLASAAPSRAGFSDALPAGQSF